MTRQTDRPLEHRSLNATNREAIGLAKLVQEGDLLLDTPYQRGDVWTLDQRVALVKSWLLGVPIPAMIIADRMARWDRNTDGDLGPAYAMIDGKQRTLTAIAWYNSEFAVPASWFPADQIEASEDTEDGPYVRFSGLTIVGQRRFMRMAQLPVCEARAGSDSEEAEIYLLVNGAGTPQTDEDLSRAERAANPDAPPCSRCKQAARRRCLVKSGDGTTVSDELLCIEHTKAELRLSSFGMAKPEWLPLPDA